MSCQRIATQTVYDQYQLKCLPGEDWVLKHDSKLADLSATMNDLDTYKDKFIVFEAVKASDTTRLTNRQPLQPINTQIISPRHSPRKSAGTNPSYDGVSDENHKAPSAISFSSLHSGKSIQPGTQSNTHTSDPPFRSSTLSHSSVKGKKIFPWDETALSTSNDAGGGIDMTGFDRYYSNWHDRIKVSFPDYNDGM